MKKHKQFILGLLSGIMISSITVYAATLNFASGDVEHTKSDGSKTTVSAAINELYGKSVTPTKVTGNAYTGASGYLNGSSALTTSTELTLANYKSNNQYAFNLGSKEQLTLPAGYYNLPINVATGGGGALSETITVTAYIYGAKYSVNDHVLARSYVVVRNSKGTVLASGYGDTDDLTDSMDYNWRNYSGKSVSATITSN